MTLNQLSILNYKNIAEAQLAFSPKFNCLIGPNGAGKTNVLDAIYFLSFCHSAQGGSDALAVRHGEPFFVVEGRYAPDDLRVNCGLKLGQKKSFKVAGKAYKRLSEHIGLIPMVTVSPRDGALIEGASEERRRLLDVIIAQTDRTYIETLNRYNKALAQRNVLLKTEEGEPDPDVLAILEEQMAAEGGSIYARRRAFVDELVPLFQQYYERVSGGSEQVAISYVSHCQRGPLLEVIRRDRAKDRAVGYSLHGIHRDDIEILLDGHPMRREGSQGQQKTFVVALKLAQFSFLKRAASTTPLLLLDDIFDKLDAHRVERIVALVGGEDFGQIFVTDTNRDHLDSILGNSGVDHRLYHVNEGTIV